jgi:hypothetical protein
MDRACTALELLDYITLSTLGFEENSGHELIRRP